MRTLKTLLLLFVAASFNLFAQSTHTIDFDGTGSDWTWVMDQNDDNPALEIVANPAADAVNGASNVAKFTARANGMNWALIYTDSDGEFTFDGTNSTVKIMVHKPTISNVAIKFEGSSDPIEIKVANTKINEWEELTFDFSGKIGSSYNRIVVIPDFVEPYVDGTDRTQENILYIDNIQVPDGVAAASGDYPTHTVDFEPAGMGADWAWTMSDNGDNPALEFVANPATAGANASATAAKFTARADGMNWALCHTNDDGQFMFDASNSMVKIMVYKPTISNVGIKFEGLSPAIELKVANTKINEWEELTFDFSAQIGNTYERLIIIPDFVEPYVDGTDRTQENVLYFDNIQLPDGVAVGPLPSPSTGSPVPTHNAANVISVYSDTYDNLEGTNFNPAWGQSTTITVDHDIAGNKTLLYEGLNYQGTEFASQDVSEFDKLHLDFWTPNATELQLFLISEGPAEIGQALTVENEKWVSVDLDLSSFTPTVDLTKVFQFKIVGNGAVYFDNMYFYKMVNASNDVAKENKVQVYSNGNEIFFNNAESFKNGKIYVYTLSGQLIEQEVVRNANQTMSLNTKGIFLVRVVDQNGSNASTTKVILR